MKWLIWVMCAYLVYGVVMTGRFLIEAMPDIVREKNPWWEALIKMILFPVAVVGMIVLGPVTKWLLWPYVLDPVIGWVMDGGHIRFARKAWAGFDRLRVDLRGRCLMSRRAKPQEAE